ncbi:hypothetical protein [Azospirillum agricola]|uniref:hypothetical protein n=1 Tax=Azospirillum agricola TaxID=1720247 RepID=UPI0015C44701|nr:hypothetical protein [Azospirillum agricola]MBP2228993.1 hypothetical protein [Azospirillum agricola]
MNRRPTLRACLAAALLAVAPLAAAVAEESPFLTPRERQESLEGRLQQRIDRAVNGLEERLAKTMIDALDGKARDGALPQALEDAMARRMASAGGASGGMAGKALPGPGGGAPRLPPLPNLGGAELVPAGATFIGCLDGRAFFQDRSGTPFLIDPRAFPAAPGGPSSCAR